MKTAISLALLLTCAFSSSAQITAGLKQFPNRSPEIEIRNTSAVSLAAFAISVAPVAQDGENRAPLLVYVDTLVDLAAMPLLPNQTYTVPVTSRIRPGHSIEALFGPPIVTAGIFTDGATTGDADLITRLILRRCNMLQGVETSLEMLSDAGRHNVPRGQLIDRFKKMANSLDHWYLPSEQQVGRSLYQSTVGKLMTLPELQVGSPFPPATFVQSETALLNRQRARLWNRFPASRMRSSRGVEIVEGKDAPNEYHRDDPNGRPGPPLRPTQSAQVPWVYGIGCSGDGARHRSQHRGLHCSKRGALAPTASDPTRSAVPDLLPAARIGTLPQA